VCVSWAATQINMDGGSLLLAYHSRFQIELLYRDAKQFTGLTHCQARSKQKIHFHLNASLTSVSLAKAAHHLNDPFKENKPFSMANVKNQYANELLLERFISTFGINPKLSKIKLIRDKIRSLGKIAA
jgi:SRSO17 transposase